MAEDADPTNDIYYDHSESEILSLKDSSSANGTFKLQERTQKSIYITVPVMMMFRTEYIGSFRYFGKFGIRNSFLIKNTITDYGVELPSITAQENQSFTAATDQFFYKGSVGLSAGAEWKFLPTTSLMLEVGYFYGVTPLHLERKEQNRSLYTIDNGVRNYFSNKANQNQLLFKISIVSLSNGITKLKLTLVIRTTTMKLCDLTANLSHSIKPTGSSCYTSGQGTLLLGYCIVMSYRVEWSGQSAAMIP